MTSPATCSGLRGALAPRGTVPGHRRPGRGVSKKRPKADGRVEGEREKVEGFISGFGRWGQRGETAAERVASKEGRRRTGGRGLGFYDGDGRARSRLIGVGRVPGALRESCMTAVLVGAPERPGGMPISTAPQQDSPVRRPRKISLSLSLSVCWGRAEAGLSWTL